MSRSQRAAATRRAGSSFADGFLVAVLVRLSEDHEVDEGRWFLEASFSRVDDQGQPTFADLDDAQVRIRHRLDGQ